MRVGTPGILGNVQSGEFVFLTGQASPQVYLNTADTINPNATAVVSIIGPQGPTGTTGPQGTVAGDTGIQGYTGFVGMQGFTGVTGYMGFMGYTGSQGTTGAQGLRGWTGILGYTGAQGAQGFTGSQGSQGFLGSPGIQGDTGAQGFTGSTGLTGSIGTQGSTGQTGAQGIGITGAKGLTGNVGPQGWTGSQGAQGFTGAQGSTIQGDKGFTGDGGNQGSTGSQGAQGLLGFPGPTGFDGAQGFTGLQGFIGWTGKRGFTGDTGAQGYTGATGSQGFIGVIGRTGETGSQGSTGSQGTTGYTGLTGNTGTQGLMGFTGAQGSTGYSPEKAFTGFTGFTGDTGMKGDTGLPGAFGFTGAQGDVGTVQSVSGGLGATTLFPVGTSSSFVYNSNITVDSNGSLQLLSTASPVVTNTYLQLPTTVTPITYLTNPSSVTGSTVYLIKNETGTYSVSASSQAVFAVFSNTFTQMVLHPSGWAYLYADTNISYPSASTYIYSYNMNTSNYSNLGFSNEIYHMGVDPLGFVFVSSGTAITKYRVNTVTGALTSLYSWSVSQGSRLYATLGYVYTYLSGTTGNILRFNNFSNSESTSFTSLIYANDATLSYLSANPNDTIIYSTTASGNIYAYSLLTSNVTLLTTTLDPATNVPFIDPYTNMMYASLSYDNSIRQIPLDGTAASSFADIALSVPGGAGSNAPVAYSRALGGFGSPKDVRYNATDSNVYVLSLHSILKITPVGEITTLVGNFPGSNNGVGNLASFNTPYAMALDTSGCNLYVADTGNNSVRRVELATATVTTVARGLSGPQGIACSPSNVYISDTNNHVIKEYNIATQSIKIIAGSNGIPGFANGVGNTARLNSPRGISFSLDAVNLYIADFSNYTIRILVILNSNLGNIVGSPGNSGFTASNLAGPVDVAVDPNNTIYISDSTNNLISSATVPIVESTSNYSFPVTSGQVISCSPYYSSGIIYFADQLNGIFTSYDTSVGEQLVVYNMKTQYPNGLYNPYVSVNVPNLYGECIVKDSQSNLYFGIRTLGIFKNGVWMQNTNIINNITSMAIDPTDTYIYSSSGNQVFKTRVSDGVTEAFVGSNNNGPAFSDGVGSNAQFYVLSDILMDLQGSNLYICDEYNHRIRSANIRTSNVITLLGDGTPASVNGRGTSAKLLFPGGLAIGLSGFLYINENPISFANQSAKLRVYNPRTSNLTTLGPGSVGTYAMAVNPQETSFYFPYGSGIQTVKFGRQIETIAGGTSGYVDSNYTNARFNFPMALSFYGNSILVADRGNYLIRAIDQTNNVTTYAGSNSITRNLTGVTPFFINVYTSKFSTITSICLDNSANIYVADAQYLRLVRSTGIVSTIASNFSNAGGMVLDPSGQFIYISDTGNHKIRQLALSNYSITDVAGSGTSGYADATSSVTSSVTPPIPPSVPGLQLWLDATDINGNGTTPANDATVSSWIDKSGNGYNTTNLQVNQAAGQLNYYTTNFTNGLGGLRLPDRASPGAAIPVGTFSNNITVFAVYKVLPEFIYSGSRNGPLLYRTNTIAGNSQHPIGIEYGNLYGETQTSSQEIMVSSIGGYETPTLVSYTFTQVVGSPFVAFYTNGSLITSRANFSPRQLDTGTLFLLAGRGDGNGFRADSIFGEVLVYNTALSGTQRQLIEGYLASKWGLTLPVNHPYYSGPPFNTIYTISPILQAQFNSPTGICISANRLFIYVSDSGNNVIRQICFSNATTSLVAGAQGAGGYAEGVGIAAVFLNPKGIQVSVDATKLYVVDGSNHVIRQIVISTQTSTLIAGSNGVTGFIDDIATAARFSSPSSIVLDSTGGVAYISDTGNNRIRQVVLSNALVSTLVGSNAGSVDGSGSSATFDAPVALAIYGGFLYTGEVNNPAVRRVNIATQTSEFLAGSNVPGYLDTQATGTISMNTPQTLNLYSNALYTMLNFQNTSAILQIPFSNYPSTTFTFCNVTADTSPVLIQNATGREVTVEVDGGTVTNSNLNSILYVSNIKTLFNTTGTTYTLV
jgi:sugar lactone lactonase YvrE